MSYVVVLVEESLACGEHRATGPFQTHADAVRWAGMWPWPKTAHTLILRMDTPRFAREVGEKENIDAKD